MTATAAPAKTVLLLLAAYLGAVVLNLHHIAWWCLPFALGVCLWRARRSPTAQRKSRRLLRNVIVVLLTLAVLIGFRTLNGIQAGASLLVAMAALKITETALRRDWLIVAGASVFLLAAACLDAQMLWRLPLYAAELFLLCMSLYALGADDEVPALPALLRHCAITLAAALPFAILLFLFVPRLAGSFWAIPQEHQATTGLSDEMNPGSISELSESDEAAARVRFESAVPAVEQRYWRGVVLHDFNGSVWRGRDMRSRYHPSVALGGTHYHYEVSLEPNGHNILIALELPQAPPDALSGAYLTDDLQLTQESPIEHTIRYELDSYPTRQTTDELRPELRKRDLDLSRSHGRNPRSLELAHSLRERADSDSAFVNLVLDYLRTGNFRYTLTPQLAEGDSVDQLLFRTHEGFCGHYASAFVLLMRAGGIPARVVAGYLGGSWNRYGGYLLIKQSDAHAWAEVWLDGQGWVRVDPTAVVAPDRLLGEIGELLPAGSVISRRFFDLPWIANALQAMQAVNAWWQDKFVGFNFDKQNHLLDLLGFKDHQLKALALLLATGGTIWLAVIGWGLRPRTVTRRRDGLSRSWRTLERKLRLAADPRAPYEGPVAYAERVGRCRPELAATVMALARRYARLRYGPSPNAIELEKFQRAVRLMRAVPARTRI
jgi:transglutaminase-like putative cysteine protease